MVKTPKASSNKISTPGSTKEFNPQPEPPGEPIKASTNKIGTEGSLRAFNPQPEPPGAPIRAASVGKILLITGVITLGVIAVVLFIVGPNLDPTFGGP